MRSIFTFVLSLLISADLFSQWTLQNPFTLKTDLTSVYFPDANNGFAVGDYGILARTTDSGNNWNCNELKDNYSKRIYSKLNSVFVCDTESYFHIKGYAVGDDGTIIQIYSSSGELLLNSGTSYSLNSVFFTSLTTGYCCGNTGTILKTTNAGTTWTKLTSGTTYSLSSIYFTDSNTGYAAGGTNTNHVGIILKTTDAGNTWKTQYSGQTNRYLYSIHFENSTTGFACGWNGTVLKTTNGGTNWVLQTSNVTSHLRSISFSSLQNGMAAGVNGTIIKTTNGGTTWIKLQSSTTEQLNSIVSLNDNSVLAVGNNGISIASTNGGTSWVPRLINNIGYTSVKFITKDLGFVCSSGLIYKTTNGGQTWVWKKTSVPTNVNVVFFIDAKNGWAASEKFLVKTTDGGETWVKNFEYLGLPLSDNEFYSVYFTDINNGWLVNVVDDSDILILNTTNGGKVWNKISVLYVSQNLMRNIKVYFKNKNEGWLIGFQEGDASDTDLINYYTSDGGKNWQLGLGFGEYGFYQLNDIVFTNNSTGYKVGGYYDIYSDDASLLIEKTTDNGVTWKVKEFSDQNNNYSAMLIALYSVSFPTASIGYAAGDGILKTTDGGNSWLIQKLPLDCVVKSVSFADADNGWAVGYRINGEDYPENYPGILLKHQKDLAPLGWMAKIKFNDHDSLSFGRDPKATDGLDGILGESELPPLPPEGVFDVRFILSNDPADVTTNKDIRNTSEQNITWKINLQYKDFPFKISWSSDNSFSRIPGELYLQDGINGTSLGVNMKDTSQVILAALPSYNTLKIKYKAPEYLLPNGLRVYYNEFDAWNLISIPSSKDIMTKSAIFGSWITSEVFGFDGKYYIANELENGKGYWAELKQGDFLYYGIPISFPIRVQKGWNLIGPFDLDVPINKITTQPYGILTTSFYGFDKGYYSASTLNPGKGYWIKASSDGVINFNVTGFAKEAEPLAVNQNNCGKITITDNSGSSSTLYDVIDKNINLQQYEMPPLPPLGIFDARYTSGLTAERLDAEGKAIILSSASYPVSIKADGIDLRLSYTVNGIQTETILQNGSSYTINESSIRVVEVKRTAERIIPKQFALHQNYPNPFNPRTRIKYDLPEKSKVNLSVYNILGERIAELVNSEMDAGYHEVEFNANNIASGVYIYRIDTDKDHSVKKMLLLK